MLTSTGSPAYPISATDSSLFQGLYYSGDAYSSASGHGPQQAIVDLNDLLNRLTGYPVSGRRPRVCGYNDAAFEAEGEGRSAVGDLDGAVGVGVVVCHCAEP